VRDDDRRCIRDGGTTTIAIFNAEVPVRRLRGGTQLPLVGRKEYASQIVDRRS